MQTFITFALTVFTGFFAIMNPIANTPIFLGLVEGEDIRTRNKIAKKATITAFIIVTAFIFAGKYIFELFGITIPAFKMAGGILIFYVGFEMLMSQKSKIHTPESADQSDSIAISPLAIPILAGPGTIVTAMNFVTNADYTHIAIVVAMFALMIWLNYMAFYSSRWIVEKVGANLIAVVGKIMGLILAIIGVDMVLEGIRLAFNL
ncbi:MAG: MarC family protein [Chitinophagaceae bacterium]|nr:MarC family protein [Chitinophagaceae bacterium]MCB9055625.1 MarC family protein [Chitinophagales bacterium]